MPRSPPRKTRAVKVNWQSEASRSDNLQARNGLMSRRTERDLLDPEVMRAELDRLSASVRPKTDEEMLQEKVMAELGRLGGSRITEDTIERSGTKFVLPETMTTQDAVVFLQQFNEQQEAYHSFSRTFRYRPIDGAAAFERALKRVFGTTGIGRRQFSFFGSTLPEFRTVQVGPNMTMQVPWGQFEVPSFEGTITLGGQHHREYGDLFWIEVNAKRKYKAQVEGLFLVLEDELKTNSIYKGKAIDGQAEPEFLDLSGVDPSNVVYSDEVITQLNANLWSVANHTKTLRELGIPRKRAVCLEGPYGTGKTLAAFLTALVCKNAPEPWTFIYARPARDSISDVMAMARLYQPAMVFFEDVDVIANNGDNDAITELLDTFDGITAKGTEIVAILTTNHKDRIHKGMVRPGRLDAMIHIGSLDRNGIERLVKATVPADLLNGGIDYDAIYRSMTVANPADEDKSFGFTPAFAKEAIDRAMRYAITREAGRPKSLSTEDFVGAAKGLHPQLLLMEDAGEGKQADPVSKSIEKVVAGVLNNTKLMDPNDGDHFDYQPVVLNGKHA
jgi:hypothetical protein